MILRTFLPEDSMFNAIALIPQSENEVNDLARMMHDLKSGKPTKLNLTNVDASPSGEPAPSGKPSASDDRWPKCGPPLPEDHLLVKGVIVVLDGHFLGIVPENCTVAGLRESGTIVASAGFGKMACIHRDFGTVSYFQWN